MQKAGGRRRNAGFLFFSSHLHWSCGQCLQATQQIGFDVFDVIEPHSHADESLRDASSLALLFCQPAMRSASGMGDRRFGVAKICRDRAHLRLVDHVIGIAARKLWAAFGVDL